MNKITKKICLVLILAIAGIASASAQRIYASELKSASTASGYNLTFTLNAAATNVDVILNSTTSSDSFVIPCGAKPIGVNTVSVTSASAPNITSGAYTWEVKATGAAITGDGPVKFTDETTNPLLNFYSAHGVAVDNSFDSPYFGRVYVTGGGASGATGSGRTTGVGIYVLDAALTDVTGQGDTPWSGNGNVSWVAGNYNSPCRDYVGSDGTVYIGDWADGNSNVWIMDPANPGANFNPVFGGTKTSSGLYQTGDGTNTGGSIIGLCVTGSGDNTKLFTIDEDYGNGAAGTNPFGLTKGDNVLSYNIGGASLPWMTDPSKVIMDNAAAAAQYTGNLGTLQYNGNSSISPDGRGGFFVSQNRNPGGDGQVVPSLIHLNAVTGFGGLISYIIDFNSGDPQWGDTGLLGGSQNAAMAVSNDGSKLAVSYSPSQYKIFDVTYDDSGTPTLTYTDSVTTQNVGLAFSMAFDAANNLYVITTASTLGGYALPTADNTFTTPAQSSQVLNFISTGIATSKAPQLQVSPNPVQDVAHISGVAVESVKLIDLAGRVIMNQKQTSADVNLSGIAAGTYVLFVNNTPVKIVKK